jgi:hypothetical protein
MYALPSTNFGLQIEFRTFSPLHWSDGFTGTKNLFLLFPPNTPLLQYSILPKYYFTTAPSPPEETMRAYRAIYPLDILALGRRHFESLASMTTPF